MVGNKQVVYHCKICGKEIKTQKWNPTEQINEHMEGVANLNFEDYRGYYGCQATPEQLKTAEAQGFDKVMRLAEHIHHLESKIEGEREEMLRAFEDFYIVVKDNNKDDKKIEEVKAEGISN